MTRLDDEIYLVPRPPGSRSYTGAGRDRDAEALRLKALGWTLQEIADQLKLTGDGPKRATAAIKRAMAVMVRFAGEEHRLLEMTSLDELEAACWRELRARHVLVQQGRVVLTDEGKAVNDDRFILETVDRIIKIKDQRARLLGLNAPTKSEVLTIDSVDAEIKRLEAELRLTRAVNQVPADDE